MLDVKAAVGCKDRSEAGGSSELLLGLGTKNHDDSVACSRRKEGGGNPRLGCVVPLDRFLRRGDVLTGLRHTSAVSHVVCPIVCCRQIFGLARSRVSHSTKKLN